MVFKYVCYHRLAVNLFCLASGYLTKIYYVTHWRHIGALLCNIGIRLNVCKYHCMNKYRK